MGYELLVYEREGFKEEKKKQMKEFWKEKKVRQKINTSF